MYDLIGDIHGHADELVALLGKLEYRLVDGVYRHPTRQVIFLGDFIDRGPKIRHVLEIVRPMVEAGSALAVMGNHELNALAFHTKDGEGYLRRRDNKNIRQHAQTMVQLKEDELQSALAWFCKLPLYLDLPGLRAVHACWDSRSIAAVEAELKEHGGVTESFLHSACRKGQPLFGPVETILKGKETKLPSGVTFTDKDGHVRSETRVRWYLPVENQSFEKYALGAGLDCQLPLDAATIAAAEPYPSDAKPVFVGHYWLSAEQPTYWTDNVACLDYSVAKGGFLCAYRWEGEQKLLEKNFVRVE